MVDYERLSSLMAAQDCVSTICATGYIFAHQLVSC